MSEHVLAASDATLVGGAVLSAHSGPLKDIRTKSNRFDMVTEADIASGIAVVRLIAERFENARFVVEEPEVCALAGVTAGTLEDDEVWIIDPLDGTTSFIHRYPCYSVSVAFARGGTPTAGAVYSPATGELISAGTNEGAFLNGTPLHCTSTPTIEEALLITGFPYDRTATLDRQLAVFSKLVRIAHGTRRDGSAAIDCCHVAAGRADGFWEFALQPWDMAAGVVALRESGARVTDIAGAEWTLATKHILAANPTLHAELLATIDAR